MKIIFNSDKYQPLTTWGTEVLTDSGVPLENVTELQITTRGGDMVECWIKVLPTSIEGLENIKAVVEADMSIIGTDDSEYEGN